MVEKNGMIWRIKKVEKNKKIKWVKWVPKQGEFFRKNI